MNFYAVELVGRQSRSVTHIVKAEDRTQVEGARRYALCSRWPAEGNSWAVIGKDEDQKIEVLNVVCRRCRQRAHIEKE